ncbi:MULTISPECIES: hypothetical protein [Pseudanabaena]|uniref:Uncharacterized protein n=2 Tax=Pseudanabaena TaxID=1152 RepID=L8MY12_9CYAN|nr:MULTISPECIES: hypothetical protein [Pseudanabaena]ELS31340.1 hypothetical protein Pse7429DRAFT_3728 [Pseudanabaena biceps PCC 7429]MDG3496402.1 hypothetical protein [Pseudanabaena catenata USMAC16]
MSSNLQYLTNEFDIRFYHWSILEAQREAREDFPSLRKLLNPEAQNIIKIFDSLSSELKLELALALPKFSQRNTLSLLGENLTDRDQELDHWFYNEANSHSQIIKQLEHLNSIQQVVDSKKLKSLISNELESILGKPFSRKGGLGYRTIIDCWSVKTWIDVVNGTFSYFHTIFHQDEKSIRLGPGVGISLGIWLGFNFNTARWICTTEDEAEQSAKSLSIFCAHFLNALPDLLQGLFYEKS